MSKYILKRFLLMIPTLFGVATLIFFLIRVVPGDVAELRLAGDSSAVSEEVLAQERARFGLDKPLWHQYAVWMWGAMQLDFGTSMWTGAPIWEEI
ncbi:MAG: ABC transporter permease, partial [Candidatus Rokuibacteriota bacterium]